MKKVVPSLLNVNGVYDKLLFPLAVEKSVGFVAINCVGAGGSLKKLICLHLLLYLMKTLQYYYSNLPEIYFLNFLNSC